MSLNILLAFWAVSFLFVITPGVDLAYAISAGIRGGKVVVPAVGGMLIGHLTAIVLVSIGVGALVSSMPVIQTVITVMGSGYLLWLGINLMLNPSSVIKQTSNTSDKTLLWLLRGIGVSGLNPKVFLLFLSLLPQFTDPRSTYPLSIQMLILGLIHIISCGIIYLVVGYGAQTMLKTRPSAAKLVSRISGVLMVSIAILLLVEQLVFK